MLYYAGGSSKTDYTETQLRAAFFQALDAVCKTYPGPRQVLVIPPDITRFHSRAGLLTCWAHEYFGPNLKAVLPALGTHAPMSPLERETMYPGLPEHLFIDHNWRQDIVTLGQVPAGFIESASEGLASFTWPAQVNKILTQGLSPRTRTPRTRSPRTRNSNNSNNNAGKNARNYFDLIISIGQVVPHEVAGMANYTKNILIGTGGREGINKSHYLGAVYGIDRILGRPQNPVRQVLNYAHRHFLKDLPLVFAHTVIGASSSQEPANPETNNDAVKGLFVGDDEDCFTRAARLSGEVNIKLLEKPLQKVVVYLNPQEYKSTWLGNKSIYRTRLALADRGELLILAPGIKEFGEDPSIDRVIRTYGYRGKEHIIELTKQHAQDPPWQGPNLNDDLSAPAHLIHGSTEGRFTVTYAPGKLTRQEIESAGYQYGDLTELLHQYNPDILQEGPNILPDGQEVFFITNPAAGLWAYKEHFNSFF